MGEMMSYLKRIGMKRSVLTALALFVAVAASAFPVTFRWNIPATVDVMTGSFLTGDVVGPEDVSVTEWVYDCPASQWMYLVARDGYKITSASVNGTAVNPAHYDGKIYVGKFMIEATLVEATLAPVERTSTLSVDVENGAAWISTKFDDGYEVELVNGSNNVLYDPDLETSLCFTGINGVEAFDKITLNGEEVPRRNQWSSSYDIPAIKSGDKIVIRVFEGGEPQLDTCELSVVLPDGMEDCIYSIRNWWLDSWETLENGKLSLLSGTDIQFNFQPEGYVYTAFLLNGKDLTDDFRNNSLRFTVDGDSELVVEGHPRDYADVIFTAYVMNPEGVELHCGKYLAEPAELTDGKPISEPIVLEAVGMSAERIMPVESTRVFTLPVSSRNPYIYVSPVEGWYIYTVQSISDGEMSELTNVTSESTTFYVVACRMENYRTATIDVRGGASLKLSASGVKSSLWGNPATTYSLTEGEQQIEFIPDYDLPLSVRTLESVANTGVFLDGEALTPDENNIFTITPWYPADGEPQDVESTVTVVVTGSPAPMSRVKLDTVDDVEGKVFYSAVRSELNPKGQALLAGTEIIVKPAVIDTTISVNGEVVNGLGEDGKFINGLNDKGEYVFAAPAGTVSVVLSKGCGITGVEAIGVSDSSVKIYGIDGRSIPASDIRTLAKGLYIVDGRKVLIR